MTLKTKSVDDPSHQLDINAIIIQRFYVQVVTKILGEVSK